MESPPPHRTPPRFVPTLTEVVSLPTTTVATSVATGAAVAAQHDSPWTAASPADVQLPTGWNALPEDLQEGIIHRVMQRVDTSLSPSLQEALMDLVATHTQLLAPLLRDEIERVVRRTVVDAVALELHGRKA